MNKSNPKNDADEDSKLKREDDKTSGDWRKAIGNTIHSLHKGSWIPNLVVGIAILLIGPTIAYQMNSKPGMVYGAAIGVTILVWIVAIALAREVREGPNVSAETPALIDDRRPWIAIKTIDLVPPEAGKPLIVLVTLINSGNTIANDFRPIVTLNVTYTNPGGEETAKFHEEANKQPNPISLAPNIEYISRSETKIPMTAEYVADIKAGKLRIYLIGDISYGNGFSTKLFAHYNSANNHFEAEPTHNEAN